MPCLRPRVAREPKERTIRAKEIAKNTFLFSRKAIFKLANKFSVHLEEKVMSTLEFSNHSYTKRVMKMAEKKEVAIPIIRVVAKPLMGPVPKRKRIKPVRKVVTLASMMAEKAFLRSEEHTSE